MMITLYKTEGEDRPRYYSVDDRQGHLFSPHCLTVTWGTAPLAGRDQLLLFDSRRELDEKLRELIQARIRSGYRVLYSFFRSAEHERLRSALTVAAVS